jgi:uncharacterized protein YggE
MPSEGGRGEGVRARVRDLEAMPIRVLGRVDPWSAADPPVGRCSARIPRCPHVASLRTLCAPAGPRAEAHWCKLKAMRTSLFSLAAAFLLAASATAQAPPERRPPPSIRTTGEATVSAKPDRVIIDIGVVTQASTAQAAASQNAGNLDAAMRALKSAAGPGAQIKTVAYSLDPNYRYPRQGQAEIAGYTARNVVQVTTDELGAAGKIIDAATQSGANTVQRLQFTLKDDQAAQSQALREAAVKARAAAEALASALGVKILGLLSADQSAPSRVQPLMGMAQLMSSPAAPPTPVAPGAIDIHASVTLTFEISQ